MADLNKSGSDMDGFFAAVQDDALARKDYLDRAAVLLEDEFSGTTRRSRSPYWTTAGVAAGMALAAAIVIVMLMPRDLSVTFGGGSALQEGEWVHAGAGMQHELAFSDGSVVGVKENTEIRVLELRSNGADMLLESGELAADIVHATDTKWSFRAGPYTVQVIGTAFNAAWNRTDKEFLLKMREGKVRITGPMLKGGQVLEAGDEMELSLMEREVSIRRDGYTESISAGASGEASEGPAVALNSADAEPAEDASEVVGAKLENSSVPRRVAPGKVVGKAARTGPPVAAAGPEDWREIARSGDYRRAVALAEEAGFDTVVATASRGDLMSLADAARLAGQPVKAEQAYTTVRTRFPSTEQAQRAAFSVGRMYFNDGRYVRAAQWFRLCINDNRAGNMTREAAGRLIEALDKAGDKVGAVAAATKYLQVFPGGPHSRIAKKIAQEAQSE